MNNLPYLIATGVVAGSLNAAGGGGSFVALPALMSLGVPAIQANAAVTVALLPGGWASAWAYRRDLQRFDVAPFIPMVLASACGGLLGAILLLSTPTQAFDAALPWLVLTATLAFALGRQQPGLSRRAVPRGSVKLLTIQLILAFYAGYFGGGVGIMMMATWRLLATDDVPAMQAGRMIMVTTANAAAAVWFGISSALVWPETLVLLVAGLVGGYGGARLTMRVRPSRVRNTVIFIGLALAFGLLVRSP